jgi:hypothetical protein
MIQKSLILWLLVLISTIFPVQASEPITLKKVQFESPYKFEEKRWFPMRRDPYLLHGQFTVFENNTFQIEYTSPESKIVRLNTDGYLEIVETNNQTSSVIQSYKNTYLPKVLLALLTNNQSYLDEVYSCNPDAQNPMVLSFKSKLSTEILPDVTVTLLPTKQIESLTFTRKGGIRIQISLITE